MQSTFSFYSQLLEVPLTKSQIKLKEKRKLSDSSTNSHSPASVISPTQKAEFQIFKAPCGETDENVRT